MSTATLGLENFRDARGGVWSYVSSSRLGKWLSCGLAFKLAYIDGLRPPTNVNLFLGKAAHRGLELFYRHRQLGVAVSAAYVSVKLLDGWAELADAEGMRFESVEQEQTVQHQATGLVTAYIAQVPPDEPLPLAVEVSVETPLVDPASGEDLGIPLVGVMDLVLGGTGSTIVDFKTTARSSEPLEITHEIQLSCYAWLFRHSSPVPEDGLEIRSLIKTKQPKVETHRYAARSEAHFRRLFAVIRAYLDALDRRRFVFRPGFGCACCDFRDGPCRKWAG